MTPMDASEFVLNMRKWVTKIIGTLELRIAK